ncbi:RRQRL motif-containing zinc-binding protein [Streptomyces sp. B8F3]|uniref:RRQRL motif-containing zinc-binding protein n=1 Tax=Streptomyces sp. B8F3 TaxID=3153573 RepID=UPI00325DE8BD
MTTAYAECYDPAGTRYGIPTYPWRLAPEGLATRRQLRARGLRPGGQPIAAQVMRLARRTGEPRVAYLYEVTKAKPVRPMTLGRWAAFDAMMIARRTCPQCRVERWYCIPRSVGICNDCARSDAHPA